MSIASLVLGILSVPLCFVIIPSILALVFGFVGLGQIRSDPGQSGRGQAIAGIVLGGVSIALFVLVLILGSADVAIE